MFAFLAVGAPVPWQGLLLAYCGGQLAVNLPITPGGLGVVEGSLTVALVAFGGGQAATVAAVLLYRLLSFWIPLPLGASCYAYLLRARRRLGRAEQPTPGASSRAIRAGADDAGLNGLGGPAPPVPAEADMATSEPEVSQARATTTKDVAPNTKIRGGTGEGRNDGDFGDDRGQAAPAHGSGLLFPWYWPPSWASSSLRAPIRACRYR